MKEGWEMKKLGEVCELNPQKREARNKLKDTDLVTFLPMEDLGILNKEIIGQKERLLKDVAGSYTYFANNDILLAKITPCFENGKVGIASNLVNGIGFGSSEYLVFRSKGNIGTEYLYYFLSREQIRIEGKKFMSGAVGHKRVSKDWIENYLIPYPPLPEQQRIVSILDEAFAAIAKAKANAEQNLRNAKEVFESYLQGVFEGKGEGWEYVALSELSTDVTDGDHMPPPKTETGIPFITISNINKENYQIDFSDTFKVSKDYFEKIKPNRKPKKGDILYTVTGSFGIPVLIEDDFEFCFQRHIGLIRPKKSIESKWLYYWILSPQAFKQANETATGTAQKTVSLKSLRNFTIPRIPLDKQQSIVQKLDTLSAETKKLEAIYQQKIKDLEELKKSILQKAFNGELNTTKAAAV